MILMRMSSFASNAGRIGTPHTGTHAATAPSVIQIHPFIRRTPPRAARPG